MKIQHERTTYCGFRLVWGIKCADVIMLKAIRAVYIIFHKCMVFLNSKHKYKNNLLLKQT